MRALTAIVMLGLLRVHRALGGELRGQKEQLGILDPEGRFMGLPLRVEYVNGRQWRVAENIHYVTAKGAISTVRRGFIFDFASVPRPLWTWMPPAGDGRNPYGLAALWHDWLFAHRKIAGRPVTFREANALFYEIMLYLGCSRRRSWLMWFAVSGPFGWWAWRRRKEADIIP